MYFLLYFYGHYVSEHCVCGGKDTESEDFQDETKRRAEWQGEKST